VSHQQDICNLDMRGAGRPVCWQFSTGVADPRGMKRAFHLCHCEAPRIQVRGLKAHARRCGNLVAAESPTTRLLREACPRAARSADPWARNDDKSKPAQPRHLVSS
jgi:hypothetical protein